MEKLKKISMFKYDVPYMCTHQIDPGESESEVYFSIRAEQKSYERSELWKKRKKILCSNIMLLTCVPTKSTPGNQYLRFILGSERSEKSYERSDLWKK